MRLLKLLPNGEFCLTDEFLDDAIPRYAILSHRWEDNDQEVTFEDMVHGLGQEKAGYDKIKFCGEQAVRDDLQYFWVDSCCIDKSKHGEHQKAINSMFRWYRNAIRCYVFLSDVSVSPSDINDECNSQSWELDFQNSKWFTRGWTLQELLAPASVEFFSRNRVRLGDKGLLEKQIHQITGIEIRALQREPLTQFSVKDRFSWIERRKTSFEEDKAYSMLGILDVYMPLRYGEGIANAFKRLEDEIDKQKTCIQDLHITNPCHDKNRIEDTKGGLLKDSYRWILENSDFQRWRDNQQSRLLWIKGDPGKGKTMLLCGIINELEKSISKTDILSYFFCQATDLRINHATAILRGLLYLLLNQQPSLVSHIQKKYDHAGKALFEDTNAWTAICEMFMNILQDPNLNNTYLVIDALDECVADLPKLLKLVVQTSSISRVKWIVSSRNWPNIEERLSLHDSQMIVGLELKQNTSQVSQAVDAYIDHGVSNLAAIQYNKLLQNQVRDKIQQKANGTFLWASLVIKELEDAESWEMLQVIEEVPVDLKDVYYHMMKQIQLLKRGKPELCRNILSAAAAAYRPLHLTELGVLSGLPPDILGSCESITTIVKLCGSFLTIRDNIVYTIHQSAQDFLSTQRFIFPSGIDDVHYTIFSRSLQVMFKTLRQDVYSLSAPAISIDQVKQPDPDPLAAARYSCLYWVDHLIDCNIKGKCNNDLKDGGSVHSFLCQSYLYWLEALSLLKSLPNGIVMIMKLENWLQVSYTTFSVNSTRGSPTNLKRPTKAPIYMHLYMMQGGSLYTTDQLLNRHPFNHIAQHLSSPRREVLSEKHSRSISLLG